MLMFTMNLQEGALVHHIFEIAFSISFPHTHLLSHLHYQITVSKVYLRKAAWDTAHIIRHRADCQCVPKKQDLKGGSFFFFKHLVVPVMQSLLTRN